MEDVYYHPEELTQTMLGGMVSNIKPDRTDLDLLYACLLDWGVEISLSHTQEAVSYTHLEQGHPSGRKDTGADAVGNTCE